MTLRFVDLTWDALKSEDTTATRNALSLLATIDSDEAVRLASVIFSDSTNRARSGLSEAELTSRLAAIGLRDAPINVRDRSRSWISAALNGEGTAKKVAVFLKDGVSSSVQFEHVSRRHPAPPGTPKPCVIAYPGKYKHVAEYLKRIIEAEFGNATYELVEDDDLNAIVVAVNVS